MRKPFDILAEGPSSENGRGDWMAIELFLMGVAGWESPLYCLLLARLEWRQRQLKYRLLVPAVERDHRNPASHGSAQANQTQTPLVHKHYDWPTAAGVPVEGVP